MLAPLKVADLERIDLSWLCVQPFLLAVRAQTVEAKSEKYRLLNEGQRALFLFYAYHNHAICSAAEFYWFSHFFAVELSAWEGLVAAMVFYGDDEMRCLLAEVLEIVADKKRGAECMWQAASPSDLDTDKALWGVVSGLYDRYIKASRRTIASMNTYVRSHLNDFVEVKN